MRSKTGRPQVFRLLALGSLLAISGAQVCPLQSPSKSCVAGTFNALLSSYGASIERIGVVPTSTGCFGESNTVNQGYGAYNYALGVGGSCVVLVKRDTYRFGLILPNNSTWKGSLLTSGCYSFSGGINWWDMGPGVSIYGMATMSTDTGHNSTGDDMSWARGNVHAQEDWGWRAVEGSVDLAKKMVNTYYGKFGRKLSYSYYSGCSTGGRQGLKQIQMAQTSFNGALIGAPAWEQYGLMPWIAKVGTDYAASGSNGSISEGPGGQWEGIITQVNLACDTKDGLKDSIISRPDLCRFEDIAGDYLQCGGQFALPEPQCLSAYQISVMSNFYKDYTVGNDLIYRPPGLGSESDLSSVILLLANAGNWDRQWAKQFLSAADDYAADDVAVKARQVNPGNATADRFDISQFKQSNGKIIMYQGLADGVIAHPGTTKYFESTRAAMGGNVDSFFRYFQVPGMRHCAGSDVAVDSSGNSSYIAPWMMGGMAQYTAAINSGLEAQARQLLGKPETDAFTALQKWVETPGATGPASIIATTWFTGNHSVWRQRPLCPYPQRANLKTGQNPDVASSWTCSS